jgi:hypothetical protein
VQLTTVLASSEYRLTATANVNVTDAPANRRETYVPGGGPD